MSRNYANFFDCGIEDDELPIIKFNSLISVTISTVMCLAAKCPLPKSNVETTIKFLSTITDDNGRIPKNIKGFLTVLNDYKGPYDNDLKENVFDKPPVEKPSREKEKKALPDTDSIQKTSTNKLIPREGSFIPEPRTPPKKVTKPASRIGEKEVKRSIKPPSIKNPITSSKSTISNK